MSTEAMKLALEALGLYARTLAPTETQKKGVEATTALQEALAQPQQEPVPAAMKTVIEAMQVDPEYAWSWHCNIAMAFVDAGGDHYTGNQGAARFMKMLANVEPAHELPSPQPAPVQQEPVAWANPNDLQNFDMKVRTNAGPLHTVPLYTSPPVQRKPLMDEEPAAWQYRDANDDGTWSAWLGCDKRLVEDEYRQVRALFTSPPAQPQQDFSDAYQGAREDLAIWKKRALEAEELNRKFIADINGQTFMGEPAQQEPVACQYAKDVAMPEYRCVGRCQYDTSPPARKPLTAREIELLDGMIEVQLDHAARCDNMANRVMAEKQKGWDMERVELLRKLKGDA